MNKRTKTSVILLAGGKGTRFQKNVPKQFLCLGQKHLAKHSFDIFLQIDEIDEIVVVCDENYQTIFLEPPLIKTVLFASPGNRRQDSVFNGLNVTSSEHGLICIHDAARPFIDRDLVLRTLHSASHFGAAAPALPLKFTIKEADDQNFVTKTFERSKIFEIQTPQVVKRELLIRGFYYAHTHNIDVTDDVGLAELINHEVKLVEGSHKNIKITYPSDIDYANYCLELEKKCHITSN